MTLGNFQKNTKYLILIVVSIAVFGGTVLGGQQLANYFAKASSCPVKNVRAEKVSANASSIVWETDDASQGRVEYGTNPQSLTFSAPEAAENKSHSVPLTLLTPNTIYYYLITIGETKCDSSGQKCEAGTCVPYSFTTTTIAGLSEEVSATPSATRAVAPQISRVVVSPEAVSLNPTSSLSLFCRAVQANIGKNEKVATEWASLKTYDVDGNGIINGLDVIKCKKSGK